MRESVEKFISQWERKSKGEMFLDALLHKRIREPLISGILTLIDQGIAEYQRDAEAPKLTEKLVRDMTAKAKGVCTSAHSGGTGTPSEPVAPVLVPVAMETRPEPGAAPAKPERSPEEAAQMAALKAKLQAPPKKRSKAS